MRGEVHSNINLSTNSSNPIRKQIRMKGDFLSSRSKSKLTTLDLAIPNSRILGFSSLTIILLTIILLIIILLITILLIIILLIIIFPIQNLLLTLHPPMIHMPLMILHGEVMFSGGLVWGCSCHERA